LALVRGPVAEIGQGHIAVVAIVVGECQAGAERHLRGDDAVATVEILVHGEHVHGAALPFGIAAPASREFRHHALRIHAASEHVAVVAISGDHLIALANGHLHPNDDRLLADVEVAEAADQPHAVHLARLLFEAADQQHFAIGFELFLAGEFRRRGVLSALFLPGYRGLGFGDRHPFLVVVSSGLLLPIT
jgi:hypothetical protein